MIPRVLIQREFGSEHHQASAAADFQANNNRLLWYTESYGDEQSGWTLARTVKYLYYNTGHVANITIRDQYQGSDNTSGGSPECGTPIAEKRGPVRSYA